MVDRGSTEAPQAAHLTEIPTVIQHVDATPVREFCREWTVGGDRCNGPAEFILWGKLIPADGLGPRCYDHAAKHVGHRALGDPAWAIFHLRDLYRADSSSVGAPGVSRG